MSDIDGYVTAIRFYKGAANTGIHIGNLWKADGTPLESATFTNETASGWQQVAFSTPVLISANTVYVASYYAPNGGYSVDRNYFAISEYSNPPLHALKDGVSGGNGTFMYGAASGFPGNTYQATNYWVDVVFNQTATSTPPVISALQVSAITTSGATVVWTTDKPTTTVLNYGPTTAYGSSVVDGVLRTSHSIDLAGLNPNTLYNFQVQATDVSGTTTTQNGTFTTLAPRTTPPVFSNIQATSITTNGATISWITDEPASSQVNYGTTSAYGSSSPLDGSLVTSHSIALTGLSPNAFYHFQVWGKDSAGNAGGSSDFTFSTLPLPPTTLWTASTAPSIASNPDAASVELGVKFTSDAAGYITGIRFYKGSANTGVHVGSLWTGGGTLLTSATFTNETASGWQQVDFSTPVLISAGTIYIASYHAPNGGYALNSGYFANAGYDNAPLHALKDGASGGNGVYLYGANSAFPANSSGASNYWVDVVFSQVATSTPPVLSNIQATQITSSAATIAWTTDKAATSLVKYGLTAGYGSSASDASPITNHSVALTGLLPNTAYHFQVQSTDVAGNTISSSDLTFSTAPRRTTPPVITNVQATAVTTSGATITWVTDEPSNSQVNYGTSSAYGSSTPVNGTAVTNHSIQLDGLSANTSYHFQVVSEDSEGNIGLSGDFSFTTSAWPPITLWATTATPAILSQADSSSVELGVKFTSDVAGFVLGIRFYKGSANTGSHVGSLWGGDGTLLATAVFTNETASGWQQVTFSNPVPIAAGTVYVASYHAPNGGYSLNSSYFANAGYDNGPLHALKDGTSGGNGVYLYSANSAFPTQSYAAGNYWVDVVFQQQ
jgi:hypothetical protein